MEAFVGGGPGVGPGGGPGFGAGKEGATANGSEKRTSVRKVESVSVLKNATSAAF
jgi:hypothetical protein